MSFSRGVRKLVGLLVAAALVSVSACMDFIGVDVAGGHLTSILVSDGRTVHVSDTVRLTAWGQVDGLLGIFNFDPVRDARWSVSDTSIATLETPAPPEPTDTLWTARILVRGRRPGEVTVSATARGVRGDATVRVVP